MTPRVSVIIPCFNSAWSIERTLRSIVAQSLADFELIVIDDGSSDDSIAVIQQFACDPRLRVVRQANLGPSAARNRGIRESTAPLIAPIDADDLWHPDYLSTLADALDHHARAPFAYSDSWRIDELDRIIPALDFPRPPRDDFIGLLSFNAVGSGSAAVFRRACLPAGETYDEKVRGAEDWKLILRLAQRGQPVFCPRKLVAYRLASTGVSRGDPARQLASVLGVVAEMERDHAHFGKRWFRDAETMMRGWLIPVFLRKQRYREALFEAIKAYGGNPLFWRNPNVRMVHAARARLAVASLFNRRTERGTPLSKLVVEGRTPFGFLPGGSN